MDAVIGLGANLGSREALLRAAAALIDATPGVTVVATSNVYETAAQTDEGSDPLSVQPDYLNAAVRVRTELDPDSLLEVALGIERKLGRDRGKEGGRNAPRTCDVDLLWADRPVRTERLVVPHPRLEGRAFALAPLLDVAPELEGIYGAALAAAGGRPDAEHLVSLGAGLPAQARDWTVEACGRDAADAIAAAVTQLGDLLDDGTGGRGFDYVEDLETPVAPDDALAAFADAALTAHLGGMTIRHAVILHLGDGRLHGRLIGAYQPALDTFQPPPLRTAELRMVMGIPTATLVLGSKRS